MYDELVERLRARADREDDYYEHGGDVIREAADAIEELQKDNAALNGTVSNLIGQIAELRKPRWIPVTERLPEEWKPVLTYQPYENDAEKPLIRVSWYIGFGDWRECERAYMLELPVTHWQPLPKPPKEET